MSIRYKTALVFLATGLIPFLAIGTLVFLDFQNALRSNAFRHLETVTNLQEARVNDLIAVYSLGASYVSEQPALRQATQMYVQASGSKEQLHQVLLAAQSGGPYGQTAPFQEVMIANPKGVVLDSTKPATVGKTLPIRSGLLLNDIFRDAEGTHLQFSAPLTQDGKVFARLYLTVNGQSLFAITSNRDGLGDTGEIFLVKQVDAKTGLFVTPLRFDSAAEFAKTVPLSQANRPSAQAVLKKSETFTSGAVGYSGQPVVAVTRYLPQAGLGIVGQIDQAEVYDPVEKLAVQVVVFAALLILFTVFVGSFMAELFVRPILHLAAAANKLRRGDFSVRARVWSSDEIGQLGHTFNVMADDLAKQDKAKSDIIALISHQLRTPVTAVKGFVSLVLNSTSKRLSQEERQMLEMAFKENEKLNKLITQILEVAHADSGKLDLKKAPTDIVELAAAVVKDHKPALQLRGQTIAFTPPHAPIIAELDSAKIGFVLGNLLTNASKYSPQKTTIKVEVGQDKKYVWLRVTDRGLGMSAAEQRKLFQKFYRIDNPKSEIAEGMGLGLYMAKKIVELHKGNLTVRSRENDGSSFAIEIPI